MASNITKKAHTKLFAFRDPDTGLYWDGNTREPSMFSRNRMGWKVRYRYDHNSKFWIPRWSKVPIIFRDKHVDLRDMRYQIDVRYFPKDNMGNEIPTKLERVEFEGKFDIETRELILDESKEISSSFKEFDETAMTAQSMRLCLSTASVANSYEKLIKNGADLSGYMHAVRIIKFANYKTEYIPFEYHYYSGIMFLKSETDIIAAMMLFGKDMSSRYCLIDIKPNI